MITISEKLFKGFNPCTNGNCIIRKPTGMHTNGHCQCILNLPRSQLQILGGRLRTFTEDYDAMAHRLDGLDK